MRVDRSRGPTRATQDADRALSTLESLDSRSPVRSVRALDADGRQVTSSSGTTDWHDLAAGGRPSRAPGSGPPSAASMITSDGDGQEASEPAPGRAKDVTVGEACSDGKARRRCSGEPTAPAASSITNVAPAEHARRPRSSRGAVSAARRDQETDRWTNRPKGRCDGDRSRNGIDRRRSPDIDGGRASSIPTVEGNAIVATGHDLGVDWQLRMEGEHPDDLDRRAARRRVHVPPGRRHRGAPGG